MLGVIRPTAEVIGNYSSSKKLGILGTKGTMKSDSYPIEIKKFFPKAEVFQHSCPMWVPLVENNEYNSEGADYFIKKDLEVLLNMNSDIDTILLACTHYPLLMGKIKEFLPGNVEVISQGKIVAESLAGYLDRHQEIKDKCSKNSQLEFYTTDSTTDFDQHSQIFFGSKVNSKHVVL